jgi:manganese/iron transport system permease protein/iron/zinc/copper transport system permease protein
VSLLFDPFEFAFFGRALLAAVLVGAIAGALGPFVVVRRMAYIGQGLSQSVLGGVGVALVYGAGLYSGAIAATIVATIAIYATRRRGVPVDTAIGIVASTMFAAGVAVISANRDRSLNISNLLFGNILGVDRNDLILVGVVAAIVAAVLFTNYKQLLAATHNPAVAAAHGVRTGWMEVLFNALLALAVVTALQVLGVLLVAATLLLPAATASLAFGSFGRLLMVSTALGVMTAVIGLYVSYYHDIASGPAIVLTGAAAFAIVAFGLPNRYRHSRAVT